MQGSGEEEGEESKSLRLSPISGVSVVVVVVVVVVSMLGFLDERPVGCADASPPQLLTFLAPAMQLHPHCAYPRRYGLFHRKQVEAMVMMMMMVVMVVVLIAMLLLLE